MFTDETYIKGNEQRMSGWMRPEDKEKDENMYVLV
jgi:hypothetical protein